MKIQKLKIEGYKNLNLDLDHKSHLIAIIGNNGSGKSNLLESISLIFKSLYNEDESVSFDYSIEYKNNRNEIIKIDKSKSKLTFHKDDETLVSIKDYLPKKLVAIYSGDEDRLWRKCYKPFYDSFIREINKTNTEGNIYLQTPQMLYLSKLYWHISLLSLAVSDLEGNQHFIENILSIEKIEKVKFDFEDKNRYKHYSNSPTLEFIRTIDGKSEYTIPELREIFEREGYIANDVYKHLYLAFTPKGSKIIRNITIKFNQHLTIEDLSEGEKKLLLIKAAFEFAEQEDSLFILDEPDAHVHLNNKELIVKTFEPYKKNRQIILTTHSPTITQCINEDELYMVNKGQLIGRRKQDIIGDLTDEFWNKQQQNVFLASKKDFVLLVEGKHDEIHIKNAFDKLKDEYKDLNFDIFQVGGEGKIRPFMTGLYETSLKSNVICVAIYDSDTDGLQSLNNQKNFFSEDENCGYRRLKDDERKDKNFFAFALIKPEGFSTDCTIENMYDSEKYEKAFNEAVKRRGGNFSNHSIDDISKKIKESSKNIIAENSKSFEKEDFKNFKPLFDLILKIKKDCSKNESADTKTNDDSKKTEKPAKEDQPVQEENVAKAGARKVSEENQPVQQVENTPDADVFYFKTKGVEAKGKYDNEKKSFIIMKGSEIVKECNTSYNPENKRKRNLLIDSIEHREEESRYIVDENIEFKSPSGASDFVNGGSSNGWNVWKNIEGQSLSKLYRNNSQDN